jgi:hypothetical protein
MDSLSYLLTGENDILFPVTGNVRKRGARAWQGMRVTSRSELGYCGIVLLSTRSVNDWSFCSHSRNT